MTHDPLTLLAFAGYGAAAALVTAIAKTRKLELPHVIRRGVNPGDRVFLIDVGFLAAPLLGGVIAAIVDGRPQTALAYGVAVGFAGTAVVNSVIDPILSKLGMSEVEPAYSDGEGKPK
jgi:hypothetical protein